MEAFIIVWAVATIIATGIGGRKGRGGTGFLLGFLLGFIGVIIIACMKPTQEEQIRRAQEQMSVQYAAQQRMLSQPIYPQQWQQPPPQQGHFPQKGNGQ
jgi:hypothetical protein